MATTQSTTSSGLLGTANDPFTSINQAVNTPTSTQAAPASGVSTNNSINPVTGLSNGSATALGTQNFSPIGVPQISQATPIAASTVNPVQRTVDPNTETVNGQLQNIVNKDSPLMQLAANRADQLSNSRGLLNSSLAVGAAQDAVIQNALPIAQNDASTYSNAAANNVQTDNNAAQYNASALNNTAQFNQNMGQTINASNLDSQTKQYLSQVQANYQTLMQANTSSSQLFSNITQNIMNIQNNANLTGTTKADAINQQLSFLKTGMGISGAINSLNLSGLISFSNPGGSSGSSSSIPTASAPVSAPPSVNGSYSGQVVNGYQWMTGAPTPGWQGLVSSQGQWVKM